MGGTVRQEVHVQAGVDDQVARDKWLRDERTKLKKKLSPGGNFQCRRVGAVFSGTPGSTCVFKGSRCDGNEKTEENRAFMLCPK